MFNSSQIAARQKMIEADAEAAYANFSAGKINQKKFDEIMDLCEKNQATLKEQAKTLRRAKSFATCASPDEYDPSTQPGLKAVKQKNVSPADLPREEMRGMFEAARHRQPYMAKVPHKSPVFEGSPWNPSGGGGLLPSVNVPGLTMGLRYESTVVRISDYIPTITLDAPSIEYLKHSGDAVQPQVTVEGGVKVDVGQQWTTESCVPIKLAALASASMDIPNDFSEFQMFMEKDLVAAGADAENDQILLGTGSPGMQGLIAAPNVLSRSYNSGTDSSGIDTIVQAFTDIRVGAARAKADLVITHPKTWDSLRRTKTTTGAYVLSMMDPTSIGDLTTIFGTPVLETTWCPEGTAVVMDSNLAARWYVRTALEVAVNPWGDTEWQQNLVSFRAEERANLAILYPQAISIVVGLSSDTGAS